MVRLKVLPNSFLPPCISRFNSIVVRLKEPVEHSHFSDAKLFQFHSGSIKRGMLSQKPAREIGFQFHSGSIKSVLDLSKCHAVRMFQFHSGSIKSSAMKSRMFRAFMFQFHSGSIKRGLPGLAGARGLQFQFHSGSIKRMRRALKSLVEKKVSIP